MWLVTWKLLTKRVKLEAILMATLLALPLRHFIGKEDSCQTRASSGHFSTGGTFGIIRAKVVFTECERSDNCRESLLHKIKIILLSMLTKDTLGFGVCVQTLWARGLSFQISI